VAAEVRGGNDGWNSQDSLDELALLADTAGALVVGRAVQRLERPNSAYYIGRGKVREIASQPSQQRNLEEALKVKVLDRTALILDIFAQHARSHEGRLQVELAQHQYLLPRLRGQWSHLERLEGRIGTRGPGETQLETDRRLIRGKIQHLKAELERVRRQRSIYRQRRAKRGVPVVSLVGYTNAGKSTLMRALSGADVLVEDKLFATLDPVTRRVRLPAGGAALLTDTGGFVHKLPAQLVAAFRATLEELAEADLLVHVVDITHPNAAEQSQTVEDTLAELGLAGKPRITVLNKVDLLQGQDGRFIEDLADLKEFEPSLRYWRRDALMVSALQGWRLGELLERMERALATGPAAAEEPPAYRAVG